MNMDIDNNSDKENFAAWPKIAYPTLPPATFQQRSAAENTKPQTQHDIYSSPCRSGHSTSNTGRRRAPAWVASLMQTPPRASHAEKVRNIFTSPKPGKRRTVPDRSSEEDIKPLSPGVKISRGAASDTSTSTSSTGSSSLTSESGLENRLSPAKAPAANSAKKRTHSPQTIEEFADMQSSASESAPSDFERNTNTTKDNCNIPPTEHESSDEWTGDEVFLPRAVRQRNRELTKQRHFDKSHLPNTNYGSPTPPSPPMLRRAAIAASTKSGPLRSPRNSRFRAAQPVLAEHPKLLKRRVELPSDHRASDADDEDDPDA